jgi:hypothetical protein
MFAKMQFTPVWPYFQPLPAAYFGIHGVERMKTGHDLFTVPTIE